MVCLIKPLFEVTSSEIRRSGQINQRDVLYDILVNTCEFYLNNGLHILGLTHSPVRGNNGTLEYLIAVYWNHFDLPNIDTTYHEYINTILDTSQQLEKYKK